MLRLNIGLALGGLAAVAAGLLGGWALFDGLPLQTSALAAAQSASPSVAVTLTAEPAPAARTPAGGAPDPASVPAPVTAPNPAVEAPPAGPSTAGPNAPASNDAADKPHIHLDGERSALSYEGEAGSLYVNKDRLSVRTPFGKFDIDW